MSLDWFPIGGEPKTIVRIARQFLDLLAEEQVESIKADPLRRDDANITTGLPPDVWHFQGETWALVDAQLSITNLRPDIFAPREPSRRGRGTVWDGPGLVIDAQDFARQDATSPWRAQGSSSILCELPLQQREDGAWEVGLIPAGAGYWTNEDGSKEDSPYDRLTHRFYAYLRTRLRRLSVPNEEPTSIAAAEPELASNRKASGEPRERPPWIFADEVERALGQLGHSARSVYSTCRESLGNGARMPTVQEIAYSASISERHAKRLLKELRDNNLLPRGSRSARAGNTAGVNPAEIGHLKTP
jgi:hypothetical protein